MNQWPVASHGGLPLMRGHRPSYQAKMSMHKGWPHKRGTTVLAQTVLKTPLGPEYVTARLWFSGNKFVSDCFRRGKHSVYQNYRYTSCDIIYLKFEITDQ